MKSNFLVSPLFWILFSMVACTGKSSDSGTVVSDTAYDMAQDSPVSRPSAENNDTKFNSGAVQSNNCDGFLKDYESFTMEYLNVMKRYASDPTNEALMNQLAGYDMKIKEFSDRYLTILNNCASDPSFTQEYLNITNRLTKVAEEAFR